MSMKTKQLQAHPRTFPVRRLAVATLLAGALIGGCSNGKAKDKDPAEGKETAVPVETGSLPTSVDALKRVVVGRSGGGPVWLSDVATVVDGSSEPVDYVRQYTKSGEARAAVASGSTTALRRTPGCLAMLPAWILPILPAPKIATSIR